MQGRMKNIKNIYKWKYENWSPLTMWIAKVFEHYIKKWFDLITE